MSFAIPRNVPNFEAKTSRESEDSKWRAKSRDLPYYKDKPYRSVHGGRMPRRRKAIVVGLVFIAVFYLVYQFGKGSKDGRLPSIPSLRGGPKTWAERQQAVKQAFERSWAGYRKYGWGLDEYHPLSKGGKNMGPKPLGWIIVDSLDTMAIMGLKAQLNDARDWVKNVLNYDMDYEVNTFETTIRMLGGLLSAYYLTKDQLYLNKAKDLGERLVGAFDSPSGIPYASVNLHTGRGKESHADMGASSTAEAATVQLELKYLSMLTGDAKYWKLAEKVHAVIDSNHSPDGLVPIFIQPGTGKFQGRLIRLGSRGDSYYEYLIKMYLQTGMEEDVYRQMYDEAVNGIKKNLVETSYPNQLTYIAELENGVGGPTVPKMDHLVCFAGGMFALGATHGNLVETSRREDWSTLQESDLQLGRELTRSCYEMYARTETGLAPEIAIFNRDPEKTEDFHIKLADAHNLQRPETVESLFVLWRVTKNPVYREWGWKIFEAFEKYTRVEGDAGYTSLDNVRQIPPKRRDNMESFWLSETLKYLYLLFDDSDQLPLTDVVFNTEAHPFPIFSMSKENFVTGWHREKSKI